MKKWQKYLYLGFIGTLTTTTISAAYWQTSRYFQAKKRWKVIAQELSTDNPENISEIKDLTSFKYVSINGKL